VAAKKTARTRVARTSLAPGREPATAAIEAGAPLRARKTGEVIADRLRRQIVRGDLQVGDRLPSEEELTAHFGIARTTLREALRILESQQLIEIRRGRGGGPVVTMPAVQSLALGMAVLLQMSATTVGDLDRARAMIEPQLAGELARSHGPDDLAALEAAVNAAAVAARNEDRLAFAAAVTQLHETIMERAGNTTMAVFSRLLHELVEHYYLDSAASADPPTMQRAVRSYRKFVKLVESGDAATAEDHWRKQMAYTSEKRPQNAVLDLFEA